MPPWKVTMARRSDRAYPEPPLDPSDEELTRDWTLSAEDRREVLRPVRDNAIRHRFAVASRRQLIGCCRSPTELAVAIARPASSRWAHSLRHRQPFHSRDTS